MILISKIIARMLTTRQLFGFLGSAPNERIEDTLAQQAQQTQVTSAFTAMSVAFLPLTFCTSVCCLLFTI